MYVGSWIDKECTDMEGQSLLSHVAESGGVESIRYLLDLGVTLASCAARADEISCNHCGKNRLLIDTTAEEENEIYPHLTACKFNKLHVVRLLEDYGKQIFKSMEAEN